MGIGASIFLIAVGAVLAFAVKATVAGIDIHVVGWILMGAGVLGLIWSLVLFAPRRRTVTTTGPRVVTADSSPEVLVRSRPDDVAITEQVVREDGPSYPA